MALGYEDMDSLLPCGFCDGLRFWFSGAEWCCSHCEQCTLKSPIQIVLTSESKRASVESESSFPSAG